LTVLQDIIIKEMAGNGFEMDIALSKPIVERTTGDLKNGIPGAGGI
jgi:hypothetical protein